jgi:hypothetical protein
MESGALGKQACLFPWAQKVLRDLSSPPSHLAYQNELWKTVQDVYHIQKLKLSQIKNSVKSVQYMSISFFPYFDFGKKIWTLSEPTTVPTFLAPSLVQNDIPTTVLHCQGRKLIIPEQNKIWAKVWFHLSHTDCRYRTSPPLVTSISCSLLSRMQWVVPRCEDQNMLHSC